MMACAALLALAPAAGATSVRQGPPTPYGGSTLVVTAGPGEANSIAFRNEGFAWVVEDGSAPVTAGAGCLQASPNRADCNLPAPPDLVVDLADGNDVFAITMPSITLGLEVRVAGGPGADALSAATQMNALSKLDGGEDDDVLAGGFPAQDWLTGGPGNDSLRARNGDDSDQLDCGDGVDAVTADAGDVIDANCESRPVFPPVPRCVVPRVAGTKLATARRRLRKARCAAGKVTRRYSRRVRKGRVIASAPKAGTRRAAGTRVRLSVSRGRRPARR